MKAKSLSTFRTKIRHDDPCTVLVNIGDVIDGDEDHLRDLARNRLVELVDEGDEFADTEKKTAAKTPKGKK